MRLAILGQVVHQLVECADSIVDDHSVVLVLRELLKELGHFYLLLVRFKESVQSLLSGLGYLLLERR